VEEIDSQIFAALKEAEEKINNCPVYLTKELESLREYVQSASLNEESEEIIARQLLEAADYLEAGRCVDALVILDQINKDLILQ